jgi:Domain of unknown function (DUF3943)
MTPAVLAALALLQIDSSARPPAFPRPTRPRPLLAIGETVLINTLVNRVDAWGFHQDWARSGTRTWLEHLKLGWDWDEDAFFTNMFSHPYHGGLYFNAGRSNGLDYFSSVPIAFFGSWSWEYFGETYRPSLNDWFMTSFGGITLGEVFHRVGATIRDNRATGVHRLFREIGALPIDPVGGFNRLLRGQWTARGPNPDEHNPRDYVLRLGGGVRFARRFIGDSSVTTMGTFLLDLLYGDQVAEEYKAPFDVFNVRVVLTDYGGLNALRASGRLYGTNLNSPTGRTRHMLAVNQRYDFYKNPAQSVGGQSVEIGINSRWLIGSKGFGIRTALFGDGILLGAIDAPGTGLGERNYDFGPGVGARWEVALEKHGARFLRVFSQLEYIHAVSGASADHIVDFGGIEGAIPITRGLGLSASSTIFGRTSRYTDGRPRDARDYPEARLLLVWTKVGFGK